MRASSGRVSDRIEELKSSLPIIYEGATQGDLARMFRMTSADVKMKLHDLLPCGNRHGYDVWPIKEAAERLVKPPSDYIDAVLRMHPNELPKMLSKEYWAGQNSRLTYMERMGELWSTEAVMEVASGAFKTCALSLRLVTDAIEREVGMTDDQRTIATRLINTVLEDMRRKLVSGLNKRRKNSRGKSFAPGEDSESDSGL